MPCTVLPRVNCLLIEGPDARRFAQSQFSGDVGSLVEHRWQWNAWLDPQGRVQALMHLADLGDERLLAILRGGDAEAVHVRLARFLLRAKASVSVHLYSGCADRALPKGHVEIDAPGAITIGYGGRSLRLTPEAMDVDREAANAWRLADIREGWPRLPTGGPRFLPPALALERLRAVSLDKGCYPGQEIVARLHYRGGHKSSLYHLRGPVALEAGSAVLSGDGPVWVLDCAMAHDASEALVVAPQLGASTFNVLHHEYNVISGFNA